MLPLCCITSIFGSSLLFVCLFAALSTEVRYDQPEVTYAQLWPAALPVANTCLELVSG